MHRNSSFFLSKGYVSLVVQPDGAMLGRRTDNFCTGFLLELSWGRDVASPGDAHLSRLGHLRPVSVFGV